MTALAILLTLALTGLVLFLAGACNAAHLADDASEHALRQVADGQGFGVSPHNRAVALNMEQDHA